MILVIVGTADFYRLVKRMDEIAGEISEEVVIQIGRTNYKPVNAKYFTFLESIDDYMREARLIVGHGGAGTIISALMNNKKLIAVPRSRALGEHFDDHQSELVTELAGRSLITAVFDMEDLKSVVTENDSDPRPFSPSRDLNDYLAAYIDRLSRDQSG